MIIMISSGLSQDVMKVDKDLSHYNTYDFIARTHGVLPNYTAQLARAVSPQRKYPTKPLLGFCFQ